LLKTLETQNVSVIDLKPGDIFDPLNQEAVTYEENDRFTDGQIIEIVQTGYQLKDRVIRPAQVRVAK
jgi:molecular chaperone GrpE